MSEEGQQETVGCGGLLLIPFLTLKTGAELLFFASGSQQDEDPGPYRSAARKEGDPRPLTPAGARILGAMFLFWTLVLPGAFVGGAAVIYGASAAAIVPSVGLAWVVMFIGHLVSMAMFAALEPRLPHQE